MKVTIKDVAARAGVSVSTVSKVLNNWSTISEETTLKVRSVIAELQYTPNARAVAFARQTTKQIAYLTNLEKDVAYENPHMFDILCGVHRILEKAGYSIYLSDTAREAYPGETVEKIMANGSTAGIMIHGSALNSTTAELILSRGIPHMIIGTPREEQPLCWIDTNHKLGGQYAAEHLLSCGYQKIAFIGGKRSGFITQQRLSGARSVLTASGCRILPEFIFYTNATVGDARKALRKILEADAGIEAVICEDNTIALGVARELELTGKKVPEDMAFVTFNRYPYTDIITPTPTTVEIDVYDMGMQAADAMLRKLKNPSLLVQSYTTLPLLIQGKTTRPLPQ